MLPFFVLLLGSYDPDTYSLLLTIRENIAKNFIEHIYGILLDKIDIYKGIYNNEHVFLLFDKENPMIYVISKTELVDTVYIDDTSKASNILRDSDILVKDRLSVLDKFRILAEYKNTLAFFIIRDKELTRCGEIVELLFLLKLGIDPGKVYFLYNNQISISSMIKEMINYLGLNVRTYKSRNELLSEINSIIYYLMRRYLE